MNILLVTPYFYPAWYFGGPPRIAFEFVKQLTKAGHQVTVFSSDVCDLYTRVGRTQDLVEGVHIRYFRNLSNRLSARWLYFNPLHFRQVVQQEISRFDVVHINEFRTLMSYFTARAAVRSRIPTLLHLRGALPNQFQKRGLKRLFDLYFGNFLLQHATRLIALHEDEKREILKHGVSPERVFVAPNAVVDADFQDLNGRDEKRRSWNVKENQTVILFLGRLHKDKGIACIFDALSRLSPDRFQLVLAGPDFGHQEHLQREIARRGLAHSIHFLGLVTGEEQRAVLAAADVMLLPSRSEGLPVSILEAMAAGVPVIVSPACHLPEIETSGAGYVVENDGGKIAEAVEHLAQGGAPFRRKMGEKGQCLVRENFSWPAVIGKFNALYQTICQSPI